MVIQEYLQKNKQIMRIFNWFKTNSEEEKIDEYFNKMPEYKVREGILWFNNYFKERNYTTEEINQDYDFNSLKRRLVEIRDEKLNQLLNGCI